jgi:hypothetical protein
MIWNISRYVCRWCEICESSQIFTKHWIGGCVGSHNWSGQFWRREKSFALTGIQMPDHPVHTVVTVLATLWKPQYTETQTYLSVCHLVCYVQPKENVQFLKLPWHFLIFSPDIIKGHIFTLSPHVLLIFSDCHVDPTLKFWWLPVI